jgi:hypothetical protein
MESKSPKILEANLISELTMMAKDAKLKIDADSPGKYFARLINCTT